MDRFGWYRFRTPGRFNRILYRKPLRLDLPCRLRSVGHYRITLGWEERLPPRDLVQFCWCAQGQGEALIDDRFQAVTAGTVWWWWPREIHHVRCTGRWEYRLLTLDGLLAEQLARAYGPTCHRLHPAGPCPAERFESLTDLLMLDPALGERRAALAALALFATAVPVATIAAPKSDPLTARLLAILEGQAFGRGSEQPSLAALAAELGVHRATLCRRFRDAYGRSPQQHLTHLRLERAIDLLRDGVGVTEAARAVGWQDSRRLARLMHQVAGCRPCDLLAGRLGHPPASR